MTSIYPPRMEFALKYWDRSSFVGLSNTTIANRRYSQTFRFWTVLLKYDGTIKSITHLRCTIFGLGASHSWDLHWLEWLGHIINARCLDSFGIFYQLRKVLIRKWVGVASLWDGRNMGTLTSVLSQARRLGTFGFGSPKSFNEILRTRSCASGIFNSRLSIFMILYPWVWLSSALLFTWPSCKRCCHIGDRSQNAKLRGFCCICPSVDLFILCGFSVPNLLSISRKCAWCMEMPSE